MDDDEDRYFDFGAALLIAVAPAIVEHVIAPLLRHVMTSSGVAKPKRKRRKPAATFAVYVARERGES